MYIYIYIYTILAYKQNTRIYIYIYIYIYTHTYIYCMTWQSGRLDTASPTAAPYRAGVGLVQPNIDHSGASRARSELRL